MAVSDEIQQLAKEWLRLDRNPATRQEITDLLASGDEADLRKRLGSRIEFGTAGLRARMEAGFSRMNDLTVIQATQGLVAYILAQHGGDPTGLSVVLGHDHRAFGSLSSARFTRLTAAVFLHKGIKVYYYRHLVHTPMVPFGVKALGATCGIMMTASHNPKADNGYKLYWNNGCQIIPPVDAGIAAAILDNLEPWVWDDTLVESLLATPGNEHKVEDPTARMVQAYMSTVRDLDALVSMRDRNRHVPALRICYTAMHGVGLPFIRRAFDVAGLPPFFLTPEQVHPDPDFPTVAFPNPEEGKGALELACRAADLHQCRVILANDPDADRLAVAEKQIPRDGSAPYWHIFSGNQIGIMLAAFVMDGYRRKYGASTKLGCLTTTVSSMMIKQMAHDEGVEFEETLTGFKWLGNRAIAMETEGRADKVFFAFEQAIGFMCGDAVRDKDGVSAGVCVAELAHWLAGHPDEAHPHTLVEFLQSLYVKYGFFASNDGYVVEPDPKRVDAMFVKIRPQSVYSADLDAIASGAAPEPEYPTHLGDFAVRTVRDVTVGYDSTTKSRRPVLPTMPGAHMLTFTFDVPAAAWAEAAHPHVALMPCSMTLRTSGTEPKVKYYTELAARWTGPADVPNVDKIKAMQAAAEAALAELVKLTKEQWLVV
ncbi:Phosphoglucomutase-2 [Allomyces javanicus]|nr:Phosphoglucomutase-2 [Allomyces javanicus]